MGKRLGEFPFEEEEKESFMRLLTGAEIVRMVRERSNSRREALDHAEGGWRSDYNWLGCTTDADFWNGSTALRAKRPTVIPSLMVQSGGCDESLVVQFLNAHWDRANRIIGWDDYVQIIGSNKPYGTYNVPRKGMKYT